MEILYNKNFRGTHNNQGKRLFYYIFQLDLIGSKEYKKSFHVYSILLLKSV